MVRPILSSDWMVRPILSSDWMARPILSSDWMARPILSSDWIFFFFLGGGYWDLTPQQQPGSYQGGEMMTMKSVFWWRKHPSHIVLRLDGPSPCHLTWRPAFQIMIGCDGDICPSSFSIGVILQNQSPHPLVVWQQANLPAILIRLTSPVASASYRRDGFSLVTLTEHSAFPAHPDNNPKGSSGGHSLVT